MGNLGCVIPTFTVTVNPMEADEMTFVPPSPPEHHVRGGKTANDNKDEVTDDAKVNEEIGQQLRFYRQRNPQL